MCCILCSKGYQREQTPGSNQHKVYGRKNYFLFFFLLRVWILLIQSKKESFSIQWALSTLEENCASSCSRLTLVMCLPFSKIAPLWIKKQEMFYIAFVAFPFHSEAGTGEQKTIMEGTKCIKKSGLGKKEESKKESRGCSGRQHSHKNFLIVRLFV